MRIICGGLAEPDLRIGRVAFQLLVDSVDVIVHNGNLVNYARTYDALEPGKRSWQLGAFAPDTDRTPQDLAIWPLTPSSTAETPSRWSGVRCQRSR
ncbi:SDR family oxidoreductase [Mycobacterium uberis]|uniref:SDR family oxidoreductase n=1 Tax=Mycobacterium uberis TaxID=2162698 RepID=UPI001FB1FE7D|nr:SDR family oxidoreductase [Mycobacterium uberis]